MDSGPYNVISATHPRTQQLVKQDGGRAQGGDEIQGRLCLLGAAPISLPEGPSSDYIQYPAAPGSPAMSPTRGSDLGVYTGAEQGWELCSRGIRRAASLDNVHMITADGDDAGTFDQQPCAWTRNETELTGESPLYPTPANSSAGGRPALCEPQIESCDIRSCSPESLESSPMPVVTAATDLGSRSSTHITDGALAEPLPDGPSHIVNIAHTIRSHPHRTVSEQTGSIHFKCSPQSA